MVDSDGVVTDVVDSEEVDGVEGVDGVVTVDYPVGVVMVSLDSYAPKFLLN